MRIIALLCFLASTCCLFAEIISFDNGLTEVAMDDSTGRFSMGTPDGDPYIQGFPSSVEGGYVVIRVEGSSYSNKPGIGTPLTLLDEGRIPEDYYMTIQWIRDPIRLWQKFYLMPEDSLDAFCNIELLAYNDDADSHAVGFKIFIDATVGDNINPILEFATGVQNTTCKFPGGTVPAYWTLYENSIHQDTSYALAQGVPFGNEMIYPDEVAFANASDLDIADWFYTFFPGDDLTDLAISFRWDNITLSPYSWYIVQIYYGGGYPSFGIKEINKRPNTLSLGHPYPNPFNAQVSVPFEIIEHPHFISWNIYNLNGRVVRHSEPEKLEPGDYKVSWDARTDYGQEVGSGIYLFTMWADGVRYSKRLIVLE